MPDITAANVTITVLKRYPMHRGYRNYCQISYGDGVLTYPAGGVPMPAAGQFGLRQTLERLNILDNDDSQGVFHKYDHTNTKIRHWFPTQQTAATGNRAGVEYTGGTTAVPATTLFAYAEGW